MNKPRNVVMSLDPVRMKLGRVTADVNGVLKPTLNNTNNISTLYISHITHKLNIVLEMTGSELAFPRPYGHMFNNVVVCTRVECNRRN